MWAYLLSLALPLENAGLFQMSASDLRLQPKSSWDGERPFLGAVDLNAASKSSKPCLNEDF